MTVVKNRWKKIIHQVFDGQSDLRENVFRLRLVHSALGYQPLEQFSGRRVLHYQIVFRIRLDHFEQSEMGFTRYYILYFIMHIRGATVGLSGWIGGRRRERNVLISFIYVI